MKNLFYLVIIICLPLIAFFQFQNWRKFNPPSEYTEAISAEIDPNYHDQDLLLSYYENLQNAATYARYCWKEFRVDVKSEQPHSPKHETYIKTYNQYLTQAQLAKQKLTLSAQLKARGFSNENIKSIEENGELVPASIQNSMLNKTIAKEGDRNALIFDVQKKLVERGYEMPLDGFFKTETLDALIKFQTESGIFPSGEIDTETLKKLFN
ncbi:MAG: peptidoglycan-binding domain-containing protein [Bacteroidota bacterium]